jgi:hypothetical protein
MALLTLKNDGAEKTLKSVRTDLHQVTIFYFRGKDVSQAYNQKNIYPKTLQSDEHMVFQIIILPDFIGEYRGNIYFEFSNNTIIVVGITFKAIDNIYNIQSIYYSNWLGSKLLTIPISITNPHSKVLIIKEVVNSFSSINLVWPNGQPVTSNHASLNTSMLEVSPKTNKNILQINFYKEVPGVEYGLLQLKTDKDTLIIPVLVRVEVMALKIFPQYHNFGLIDMSATTKQLLPIILTNVHKNPIQIFAIYSKYEDDIIEYIPKNKACKDYKYDACVIKPMETIDFGYFLFDPANIVKTNPKDMTRYQGHIVIQTNYSEYPFVEFFYEYLLTDSVFYFEKTQHDIQLSHLRAKPLNVKLYGKVKPGIKLLPSKSEIDNCLKVNLDDNKNVQDLKYIIKVFQKENYQEYNNMKFYYINFETNTGSRILFPIRLYDNTIDLHYCDRVDNYRKCLTENYSAYKQVNFKATYLNVNMGVIQINEVGKRYFSLINNNPGEGKIVDFETTNPDILLNIESVEDVYTHESIKKDKASNWLMNSMSNKANKNPKDRISYIVEQDSYLYVSIIARTSSTESLSIQGNITIFFDNDVTITINVFAYFITGSLNITPSLIRFEPAFPGLVQSKIVSSKSSFNVSVYLLSITSEDERIFPVVLNSQLDKNVRTELVKITFDPSRVQLDENFMKNKEVNITGNKYLTYRELYLWREKQKLWELLGSQGKTEVNTKVKITTHIQSEIVTVRAFLTKPSLVKKDEVDFGLVQIGEVENKYIDIFNPSDEYMSIQMLLSTDEYSDIYNNTIFNNYINKIDINNDNDLTLINCQFFNSTRLDNISTNFTHNLLNRKDKKKPEEENQVYSVLLEDELKFDDINNKVFQKEDLLELIAANSEENVRISLLKHNRAICNPNSIKKNELVSKDGYKHIADKVFTEQFYQEIPVIKRMTESLQTQQQKAQKDISTNIFDKIGYFIKNLFRPDIIIRKKKIEERRQDFYLPQAISSQNYIIKPHQSLNIGPIVYNPSNFHLNTATLFIKNNLTILYPIKLKGKGGSGLLEYSVESEGKFINIDKLDFIVDSIEQEQDVIVKKIKMKNVGNLPFRINNITIENQGCEAFGLKILDCESVELGSEESREIRVSVQPDYDFYFIEKDILIYTQYTTMKLHVSVTISNDVLKSRNRLFCLDNFRTYGYISVLFVVLIASFIIYILHFEFYRSAKKKTNGGIQFISSKELIENNPILQFENLFIKSYRKFNQEFYDDFTSKNESPTEEPVESFNPRGSVQSKEIELEKKSESAEQIEVKSDKANEKEQPKGKETPPKKIIKPKEKEVVKVKPTKKPIGFEKKPEKKEEEKKPTITDKNVVNTAAAEKNIHLNKFDNYNYANKNKEEFANANNEGYQHYNSTSSDGAQNNWDGNYNNYWQKNYYYNNRGRYDNRGYYNYQQQGSNVAGYNQPIASYNSGNSYNKQSSLPTVPSRDLTYRDSIKSDYSDNKPRNEDTQGIDKSKETGTINNQKSDTHNDTTQAAALKDQFMSFVPDVFNMKPKAKDEDKLNKPEEEEKTITKSEQTSSKDVIHNFKSFDFTDMFNRGSQPSEAEHREDYFEEDNTSLHREKISDDHGMETKDEIKFNFNTIFGQNNMKLISNYNDYEEKEEPKFDSNKPYFDKSLFFSFDATFNTKPQGGIFNNTSSLFSTNPFAASQGGNSKLLSELRDDDGGESSEYDEKRDKLDDVQENDAEDDEEDILWGDEDTTHMVNKNDGYFDETGTYKLK